MKLLPFVVLGLFLLAGCLNKKEEAAPSTSDEEDGPQLKPFLSLPLHKGTDFRITEGWIYSKEEWEIHGCLEHYGIDFAAERGTPILAAADGWAISSYHQKPGGTYKGKPIGMALGKFVQIWHPEQGVYTQYAHLEQIDEAVPYIEPTKTDDGWDPTFVYRPNGEEIPGWEEVKRGQVIGCMGDTGLYWGYQETPTHRPDPATNPSWDEVHVHFEIFTRGPDGKKNARFDPFAIEWSMIEYQDVSKSKKGELWLRNEFGLVFADE